MEEIEKAVKILNDGGIVIFPTDTAFGIGCRIDNEKSVRKLFKIRRRPENQATPVLVSSAEMAKEYLKPIPLDVQTLMNNHWPGALTIVFDCKLDKVPSLVRGGGETLGVRIPNNQTILEIINGVGVPILGPSANFHGENTPYNFNELNPELVEQVNYVVHGETTVKEQSTVIDVSQKPWRILREGAVKL